jgi:hypothetical protein
MGELRISRSILFLHVADAGEARTPLQRGAKFRELLVCTNGVRLDTPIEQVAHVPAHIRAFGGVSRKIAEANALHESRDEEAFGLFVLRHRLEIVASSDSAAFARSFSRDSESASAFGGALPLAVSWL